MIAHVRFPIAQPFMGGMEAHCDLLVRTLQRRGHDVTLFASGDSAADLPVHPVAPVAYEAEIPWAIWHGRPEHRAWLMAAYSNAWEAIRAGGFDVVHNNSLFPELHDWAVADGIAMVTSLHIPPFRFLREALERGSVPWIRQTLTSASQIALWPSLDPRRTDVMWNGIDLALWPFRSQGNGRAVWFGRITPNKGTHVALEAASAAGIGLDVIGPVECSDYFGEVEPLIRGDHRYLGQLSGEALAQAVGAASVAVATPMWDEPFGLTLIEAMASGVPVAALDRGAMREVVGDAGVIASSVQDLPAAILAAARMDRRACRVRVERNFTADAMVARYEQAYALAASAAPVASASSDLSTRALLA